MSRLVLVFLLAFAVSCRSKSAPDADAAPEPPVVTEGATGLMLTWIDEAGEFHVETQVASVPPGARERVRVQVLGGTKDPPPDTVFVADLRTPGEGGRYPVRAASSDEFEKVAVERRAKKGGAVLAARSAAPPSASAVAPASPGVIIYGADWCGPCHQLQAYLKSKGVPFVEKDIDKDPGAASEMRQKLAKIGRAAGSIPVIDVHGRILVGFDPGAVDRALAAR